MKLSCLKTTIDKSRSIIKIGGVWWGCPFTTTFWSAYIDGKVKASKVKEEQFLKQAIEDIESVKPRVYVPLAGTYILGSRLAGLTKYRGFHTVEGALDLMLAGRKKNPGRRP